MDQSARDCTDGARGLAPTDQVLSVAANVGTPLGLLGLAVAVAFYVYSRRVKQEERQLELLPPEQRAKSLDRYLTRYSVSGENLTKAQAFELLKAEMDKRYRQNLAYAGISAAVFVICFLTGTIAFVVQALGPSGRTNPNSTTGQVQQPGTSPVKQKTPWLEASVQGAKLCDPGGPTVDREKFKEPSADERADAAAKWVKKTLDKAFPCVEDKLRVSAQLRRHPAVGMRHLTIERPDALRQDRFWIFTSSPREDSKRGHPEVADSEEAVAKLLERLAPAQEVYFHVYRPGYQMKLVSLQVDGTPAEVVMPRLEGPHAMTVIVKPGGTDAQAAEQVRARLGTLGVEADTTAGHESKKIRYKDSLSPSLDPEARLAILREVRIDASVTVTTGEE